MNIFPGVPLTSAHADVFLALRAAFGDPAHIQVAFHLLLGAKKSVEEIGGLLGQSTAQAERAQESYHGAMLGIFLANRVGMRLTAIDCVAPDPEVLEHSPAFLLALRDSGRTPERSLDSRGQALRTAWVRILDVLKTSGLQDELPSLMAFSQRGDWRVDVARRREIETQTDHGRVAPPESVVPELQEAKRWNTTAVILTALSVREPNDGAREGLGLLAIAARRAALWKEAHLSEQPLDPPTIRIYRDIETSQMLPALTFGERGRAADNATRQVLQHVTGIPVRPHDSLTQAPPKIVARDDNAFLHWRLNRRETAEREWNQGFYVQAERIRSEIAQVHAPLPDTRTITIGAPSASRHVAQLA